MVHPLSNPERLRASVAFYLGRERLLLMALKHDNFDKRMDFEFLSTVRAPVPILFFIPLIKAVSTAQDSAPFASYWIEYNIVADHTLDIFSDIVVFRNVFLERKGQFSRRV